MPRTRTICAVVAAGMLVSGCSTRPRNFTASLSAPVADRAMFENDFRTCQVLVRQGHRSNFKGAAATALVTGVSTLGTGMAMAASGMVGYTTSSGAAAAASAAMPVVGILVGFGISRAIRSGKERRFKRAMDSCLAEYGYSVEHWAKVHRRDDAARIAAEGASVTQSITAVSASPEGSELSTAPLVVR